MKIVSLSAALALAAALASNTARADDPRDPAMRSAEARAHDAATIRRLNREQLAKVQARDAGYAQGWRAYREGGLSDSDARAENTRRQSQYQREMAKWRRAVAACNAGRWDYCDR